jgi:uroporphyrin-III C-methyltransferase/precorrin-2 dehydrogenase/sirohydrochlorin ferrochelatase
MAQSLNLHSLPLFMRLAGRPVILLGDGPAAEAKRRLLERAGATIVDEAGDAALAIVAIEDEAEARTVVRRLKARGILVNAVDRPVLCDFTLPAIVERDPVLFAIGTGGASAGLTAALRQRLELLLPARLGDFARALGAARVAIRARFPDGDARRRALGAALAPGGALDPLAADSDDRVARWLDGTLSTEPDRIVAIVLRSPDPDDLTLGEARLLGQADRIYHRVDVPAAILDRARADANRIACAAPPAAVGSGLSIDLEIAR